jgi:uncharacterized protein YcbX
VQLTGLFIYPVKSLRGFSVRESAIDNLGILGDRRFLVVDTDGRQLTQRQLPRMALIETELVRNELVLRAPNALPLHVPIAAPKTSLRTVSVWKSENLQAEDCGGDAARWLSAFLGTQCQLVRIGPAFRRPILDPQRAQPNDVVSFVDAYPFLVISEASLCDLNDRLVARGEESLPMNRFRPSLVISGCSAFAEDSWSRLLIGSITFRAGGACSRCIVTTTDQVTGERSVEPLRTLASYRRDPIDTTAINFGQNLIHETKSGTLRLGDLVTAL